MTKGASCSARRRVRLPLRPRAIAATRVARADYDPEIVDDDRCITSPRKNECVGCGNEQHLTRFYVVPYRFRRCFPEAFKQHASHDVVALCLRCRDVVEPAYRLRSRALEASLGPAPAPAVDQEAALRLRALGAAKTLVRDQGRIPAERREYSSWWLVSEIDKKLVLTSPRAARTVTPPNEGGLRPLKPTPQPRRNDEDADAGVPS